MKNASSFANRIASSGLIVVLAFSQIAAPLPARAAESLFFTPPAGETASFVSLTSGQTYALFCSVAEAGTGARTLHAVAIPTGATKVLFRGINQICYDYHGYSNAGDSYIVFVAQAQGASRPELWQVSLSSSSAPRSITGPLPTGMTVSTIDVSPDGRWIAYSIAPVPTGLNYYERTQAMYLVPSDGSAPPRQLPVIPANSNVYVIDNRFTPDSQTIVFASDEGGAHYEWNLRAIGINPGAVSRRLTPTSCGQGDISGCFGPITPDSRYTLANLVAGNGSPAGLYRIDLAAGSPSGLRLSDALSVGALRLIDNGQYAVTYINDQVLPPNHMVLALDGSPIAHRVLDPMPVNRNGVTNDVTACGGSCFLFLVKGSQSVGAVEVWRAAADGAAAPAPVFTVPAETTGPWAGQILDEIIKLSVSPDGSRAIIMTRDSTNSTLNLYAVPTGGGSAIHLAEWPSVQSVSVQWAMLQGNQHVALIDSPDAATSSQQLVRLDLSVVDGPRTSLSTLTRSGISSVALNRYIVYGDLDGFHLADGLTDVFVDLYPQTLSLPSLLK